MKTEENKPKFRLVWVVDDQGVDLFLAERIFTLYAEVESIYLEKKPDTALKKLRQINDAKDFPELLLLDVQMDVMDGFAFLDEMNLMPLFHASGCKVCLISAYFSPQRYTKRAESYPFIDKLITKPLEAEHLVGVN